MRPEEIKQRLYEQYHEKMRADPNFRPSKIVIGQSLYMDVKADPHYRSYYSPPTPSEEAKIFGLPIEVKMNSTELQVM